MPGKAIDRDDRRGTVTPPAIEPIHPLKTSIRTPTDPTYLQMPRSVII